MEELMTFTKDKTPIEIALSVDEKGYTTARNLYEFLELNPAHYARWCKKNIKENPYAEENIDFKPFTLNGERGGQATTDYKLTASFAKKLAMASNTEKGEQARNYFVIVEDKLKDVSSPKLPTTYLDALKKLVIAEEERIRLEAENSIMKPKAEYFDQLVDRNLLTNFRNTAKELMVGEKTFIQWLLENGYVYRDQQKKLKPYAQYSGTLFELKEWTRNGKSDVQTLVTPKGRETFRLLIK